MTDPPVHELIPYSRFLECQDRRRKIGAELTHPDQPPTTDADVPPVPHLPPAPAGTVWRNS